MTKTGQTISKRAITVTATTNSKTYDGTTSAAAIPTVTSGAIQAGDTASLLEAYTDKNVASGKALVPSGVVNDGNGGANYAVTFANNTTGVISARALTVSATGFNKFYDGTTFAFVTLSDNRIAGDSLFVSYASAAYDTKNVGTGKDVSINGISLAGAAAGNYTANTTAATTGSILVRLLVVSAAPNTKMYDGTVSAAALPIVTSGAIAAGDTANFSETYDTPNVGVSKTLTAAGAVEDGNAGANYLIIFTSSSEGVVLIRPLEVTADGKTKIYGNGDPALTYQISAGSLAASDAFSGVLDRSAGENVGSYAIGQGTLSLGTNYDLSFVGADLVISARPISVTAAADAKTYDGTTVSAGSPVLTGSFGFSDAATFSQTFATKDAGTDKTLNPALSFTTGNATNYAITFLPNYDGVIDKATLLVNAIANSKTYGNLDQLLGASLTGFQNGETATEAAVSGNADCTRAAGETVADGPYTISCDPNDLDAANYNFVSGANALFSISARSITITADPQTKVYGNADPALTYQITAGSLAFSDAFSGNLSRVAGENVGNYAIWQGSVALDDNYDLSYLGDNLSITKATLAVNALAASKTYGGADPTFAWTYSGFAFGQDAVAAGITGNTTCVRELGETVLGSPYAITCDSGTLFAANYDFAPGSPASFTIEPKDLTITANDTSKVYGNTVVFDGSEFSADGLINGDTVTSVALTSAGAAPTAGVLGSPYPIVASDAVGTGLGNYAFSYVDGALVIARAGSTTVVAFETGPYVYRGSEFGATDLVTGVGGLNASVPVVLSGDCTNVSVADGCIATATYPGDPNHAGSSDSQSITVLKANATITVTPYNVTYDGTGHTASGTAAGVLAEDLGAGLDLTNTTHVNAGSYLGDAWTFAGGTNYNDASGTVDDAIGIRALTVTADTQSKTYGNGDPGLTYAITAGSLAFGDDFSGGLSRLPGEDVGTYAIGQGALALNSNYDLTFVGADLAITPRAIEITADAQTKIYGNVDPVLTYAVTAGDLAFSDAFAGNLSRVAGDDVGSYAIGQGTLTLNTNYDLTFVGADLTITPRPVTVSADAQTRIYGDSDPALTYQISAGDLVFGDAFAGVLDRNPGEDVGNYAIGQNTLTLGTNYDLTFVGANLAITARPITVTANAPTKVYGDTDPTLSYALTAGSLGFSDGFTGSLSRVAGEDVGSYAISQGSLTLGTNYDLTFVGADLTITPATLVITVADATKVYGEANPAFSASISGLQNGDSIVPLAGALADEASPVDSVHDLRVLSRFRRTHRQLRSDHQRR